jgi:LEA14-like dessication related protein
MKPKLKNYLIIGGISVVTVAGAFLYWQFLKIKDYVIKFKRISVNKIAVNNLDFNIYLYLENKSNIKYTINKQEYSVYINDVFVSKIVNYAPNEIKAKSVNDIGVNVVVNPSKVIDKLKGVGMDFLLRPEKVKVKIDINLKVSVSIFKLNIPYVFESTLKELLSKKNE